MKNKAAILFTVILLAFVMVNFSQAALVNCGQRAANGEQNQSQDCTLSNLFQGVIKIVNFLIGSATLLAIGYVLYGGVRMILARGNPSAFEAAKDTMFYAVEGLIIVLLAYLIVNFILFFLSGGQFSLKNVPQILNLQ